MKRSVGSSATKSMLAAAVVAAAVVPPEAQAQIEPDFLFKRPAVTIGLRFGVAVPRADGFLFDDQQSQLTLEDGDFTAFSLGGQVAFRVTERLDIALDIEHARREPVSEFREWVGLDDLPIEQTTLFARTPVTVSAKVYLWDRGRSIGRFAWIPRSWTPYVGGGGGLVHYTFRQEGEFVDFDSFDIFFDIFESTGVAPLGHVFGGFDVSLGPRFVLNAEARYSWASTGLDDDFRSFGDIDLAGFQTTLGVSVRF